MNNVNNRRIIVCFVICLFILQGIAWGKSKKSKIDMVKEGYCTIWENCDMDSNTLDPQSLNVNLYLSAKKTQTQNCDQNVQLRPSHQGNVKFVTTAKSYIQSQTPHFNEEDHQNLLSAAKHFKLTYAFLGCLVLRESRWQNGLKNSLNATGIAQVRPDELSWVNSSFKNTARPEYDDLRSRWYSFWKSLQKKPPVPILLDKLKNNKLLSIAVGGYSLRSTISLLGYDPPAEKVPGLTQMEKELITAVSYNGGPSYGQSLVSKCRAKTNGPKAFMSCFEKLIKPNTESCVYFHSIQRCMTEGQNDNFDNVKELKKHCPGY